MAALVAIWASAASAAPPAKPDYARWTGEQWRQAAYYDVLFAYQQYVANHPGMYDLANPGFPATLAKARSAGLGAANVVTDRLSYDRALSAFSSVLSDGHAVLYVADNGVREDTPRYWPGFVALWRGDALKVVPRDKASDLAGATIVACEGKPIRDFIPAALTYRGFRANEDGQWWTQPTFLFYAWGEPRAEQPRQCRFRLADGREEDRPLNWARASQEDRDFFGNTAYSDRLPTGLTEPSPGIFWIALQDFQPDEAGRAAFAKLYDDVKARRAELLKAKAVVLDMRGNNGGSSEWSSTLAKLLWGKEAVDTREKPIVGIDWRTSPETIAYVREAVAMFRKQGRTEIAESWAQVSASMDKARLRGEPLWRQKDEAPPTVVVPVPTDFTAPVYVINWGSCASACLDANDVFSLFPNTKRIGAPTSADSTYMEVREVALPNGPGVAVIPNKTWVGRKRGWGEVYGADIEVTDADWSTKTFLARIEAEVQRAAGESAGSR